MTSPWVRVATPATSANLGPGFDALGLAHALWDDVAVRVTPSGLTLRIEGEGAAEVPQGETHLVVRSVRHAADRLGLDLPGIELHAVNRIPHGRGLGSSAAAICAGVVAAFRLAGRDDPELALQLAAELEGHPDNVAACLAGGFTIAWTEDGATRVCAVPPLDAIRPVVLVPPHTAATSAARAALPPSVPHADAAFAAARSALLVAGLTQDPGVLLAGTQDRLHQPYRAPDQPETAALVARLRADGLPAAVSGAGPSVLVLARSAGERQRAEAAVPAGWRVVAAGVDRLGAWRHRPPDSSTGV